MKMTKLELELITKISANIKSGDIKKIAGKCGYTREYVGKVLNVSNEIYNQEIVDTAINVINERDQKLKKAIESIA